MIARRSFAARVIIAVVATLQAAPAHAYSFGYVIPPGASCPQPIRANISQASPLSRRWSTSLPASPQTILTAAPLNTSAQLAEIAAAISDSFGAWSGVSGTILNSANFPDSIGALAQTATANACTDDAENDVDGLNTICFNQASAAFTTGVLAFTRVITANAPGASAGQSAPAAFAGQILDSDTFFRNDGQAAFATPAALATPPGQAAYDLESILINELGQWFGLGDSAVWRSALFPFAPPPGQFLGDRPTTQAPDAPLSDDDRTGLRALYPDRNDMIDVGALRGRVVPANSFSLALLPAVGQGSFVTGIVGAQVVAVDADTGSFIAGVLSGFSCDASSANSQTGAEGALQFDGSYDIERLPIDHSYLVYAESLVGLAPTADFTGAFEGLCGSSSACTVPSINTTFNPQVLSGP